MWVSYAIRKNRGIDMLREMSRASRWAVLMEGAVLICRTVEEHGLRVSCAYRGNWVREMFRRELCLLRKLCS